MAESTGTAISRTPIFNLPSQDVKKVLLKARTQSVGKGGRNPLPLLKAS